MRKDLQVGNIFPDFELPDTEGKTVTLSSLMAGRENETWPTIITFNRGQHCPKDARQLSNYAQDLEPELVLNYCKLITITTQALEESDEMKNIATASWPFLCDHEKKLVKELDLEDITDPRFDVLYIPYTFVLKPDRTIYSVYNGWFFLGRPTVEELRKDLRAIQSERSDWTYDKKRATKPSKNSD